MLDGRESLSSIDHPGFLETNTIEMVQSAHALGAAVKENGQQPTISRKMSDCRHGAPR